MKCFLYDRIITLNKIKQRTGAHRGFSGKPLEPLLF
nr:MAG TPA: hypothetical protein [Caudoviricetes sp.]